MKTKIAFLMVLMLILVQACSTGTRSDISSQQDPTVPPELQTSTAESSKPQIIQNTPEVSTAVGNSDAVTLPPVPEATQTLTPGDNPFPTNDAITMEDNGKTFTMHVGDSVLLNLGTDTYDWTVTIDNDSILRMKMGVMVIRGAQGIYDAIALGATTLTASGNPLCLQSTPPCAMPSIFFTVTIIVK